MNLSDYEYFRTDNGVLYCGLCETVLSCLDIQAASCVTDPPYGLKFMGKKWDYDVPKVATWEAVIKALKPGAYLLSFAGTRTQHRMAVNIEDAGFEIRDMIAWVYGSGFPKSLDVGKAVDKVLGNKREVVGIRKLQGKARVLKGNNFNGDYDREETDEYVDTKGNSEWEGWGTALKPALEPITLARKPLSEKTVASNVLKWGTGGLNIDESRIPINPDIDDSRLGGKGDWSSDKMAKNVYEGGYAGNRVGSSAKGRFPANLIHDGSKEVVGLFPQSSITGNRKIKNRAQQEAISTPFTRGQNAPEYTDSGSAARFFYCAKASRSERGKGNNHPTVKPIALMEYLVKLVTPQGETVLEPFGGSGSTLVACEKLGFRWIGIEQAESDCAISKRRLELELQQQRLPGGF